VSWAATTIAVVVALGVVIIGVDKGRPDPDPVAQFAHMHFCTSGSAPTVNLQLKIGSEGGTALTNVPNGHCTADEKFVTGSTLKVQVWNATGVGEVACTIQRDGRPVATAHSVLRTKPARCIGRA
jgi:hypothetical protein